LSKYKKYTFIVVLFLIITFILHSLIWNLISKHVLLVDDMVYTGDLGRSTFKLDSIYPRPSYLNKNAITLPKKHLSFNDIDGKNIDIITVGDSFSNAATQGQNPYYQDYIATINNCNVLNIPPSLGIINTIIVLNNNGILDELKPKSIIIESVERLAIQRYSQTINFAQFQRKSKVIKTLKTQKNLYLGKDSEINIINNHNIKAIKYNMQFLVNPYSTYSNSNIVKLNRNFFTSKDENSLMFHKEDISSLSRTNKESINKLNDNLNKLAEVLSDKGIKLYFMPVVDKYNVYSKYIVNNPYPKSTFFEELRKLPKEYEFIDTKAILSKELEKGVKDLYYSDDTHWSYKASEAIFKKVRFE